MKYIIPFFIILMSFSACRNPFSKENITEDSPANFSIQNTENGKIKLRLTPEVGEKKQMQMKVEVKPSGVISMAMDIIADLNMRVAQVKDSGNYYHIDFQRIRAKASVFGAVFKYDSQGDNSNLPNEIKNQIEPILSKKTIMVMDSLANVKSFKMGSNNNDNIDLNALFIPLPKKEVGIGDSWQAEQRIQNAGDETLVYTIDKISDKDVLVKVSQPEGENNQAKIEGQYLIDRKTGFTKDGILNIETNQKGNNVKLKITLDSME